MGVKQTTDVLEKGTWVLAVVVALLCVFSAVFIPRIGTSSQRELPKLNATSVPSQQAPVQQQQPLAPAPTK